MSAEPDVAMRIDEAGQNPAAVKDGLSVIHRFGTQGALDDPPLHRLFVGQSEAFDMQGP